MNRFDYIVVGGGLAGLYTAHFLSRRGSVALIALATLEDSNSYYAQGGMAAVTDEDDTPLDHYKDTMEAGRGLCLPEAVEVLTREAPDRIDELIEMGMVFDTENGHLALGLEGGHHRHRILHAGGDATGRLVTTFMIGQVKANKQITLFDHHTACDVLRIRNRCCGLWVYDEQRNAMELFLSATVVLAMGGAGALYHPTTNPPTTLGDGFGLAMRAGVELMDMEFVQFHPTALYNPDGSAFLISEAVRGEGAHLLDKNGQRFMPAVHPQAELAPRDTVARAIFTQMQKEHSPYVTLSLKHLNPERILSRFPSIAAHCKHLGLDLTRQIPVTPAAHYTMGGIKVDLYGQTSLPGLFAVGEVASTGVMGANRLASNSLIECIVFGKRIAEAPHPKTREVCSEQDISAQLPAPFPDLLPKAQSDAWQRTQGSRLMQELGALMMQKVGIIRREDSLKDAVALLQKQIEALGEEAERNIRAYFTRSRYAVALAIARGALLRRESRGGHFREDFPETLPPGEVYRTCLLQNEITHQPLHQ